MTFSAKIFVLLCLPSFILTTTLTAFRRDPTVLPLKVAISRDRRYGPWSNATAVLYQLDPTYTPTEKANIKLAMDQITSDMNGCIKFQLYQGSVHSGLDHIYIGKTLNSGGQFPSCFSFPGRVLDQVGHGQKMAIFGASSGTGCADSVREIMKYLGHALGLRNEINRPDRDRYIEIFDSNVRPDLQSLNLFRKYTANQIDYLNDTFDYDSITIHHPRKFAVPGTVVMSIRSGNGASSFGSLPRLSFGDCIGLALQYSGCKYATCQDPYPKETTASGHLPVTATQTPLMTFPSTTSTTSPTTTSTSQTSSTTSSTTVPSSTVAPSTKSATTTLATPASTPRTSTGTNLGSSTSAPVSITQPVASTLPAVSAAGLVVTVSTTVSTTRKMTTIPLELETVQQPDGMGSIAPPPQVDFGVPDSWETPEVFPDNATAGVPVEPSFSLTL